MAKKQHRYIDFVDKKRIRAHIQTSKQELIGNIHVHPGFRVKDNLNRKDEEFMSVTDVTVLGLDKKFAFVLLRVEEIVWIAPFDETEEEEEDDDETDPENT